MPHPIFAIRSDCREQIIFGVNQKRILTAFYEFDISERNFSNGLERDSFEKSVSHVITQRLWWPESVANVIIHEYTDWSHVNDPVTNRQNYIHVSMGFLISYNKKSEDLTQILGDLSIITMGDSFFLIMWSTS